MGYDLLKRSLLCLEEVEPELEAIIKRAIKDTKVNFKVRTPQEQKALVAESASKHLQSEHLKGKAVDLTAYIGPYLNKDQKELWSKCVDLAKYVGLRLTWELAVYDKIVDAVRSAAIEQKVAVRWGVCWNIEDIRKWRGTMEAARRHYIDAKHMEGQRPFIWQIGGRSHSKDAKHMEGQRPFIRAMRVELS